MTFKQTVDSRYGPGTRIKIRKLEKLKIKLSKEINHVTFLTKCKKENIIPKGFTLRAPYFSHKSKHILTVASKKLLQDRLNFHLSSKQKLLKEIENETNNLSQLIGPEFDNILISINKSAERQNKFIKQTQINKFDHLRRAKNNEMDEKSLGLPEPEKQNGQTVINMSDKILNTAETNILSKGLNFAITPKEINVLDFITGIESAVPQLSEELGDQFRSEASTVLKQTRHIKSNTKKEEREALKSLKSEKHIKILPADKGNATVLLNKTDYDKKINDVLNTGTYTLLKKDPTKTYETKIANTLRKYKQYFTDETRKRLTPHHSKTPHIYGLPKIHKENVPLRPIVSSINSPNRELCKFLLPILKPLSGHTVSNIVNSKHFVDISKNIKITENDRLVSFDVESLFTNVPVCETLNIIEHRLTNDIGLKERTKIPIDVIMELLRLCIEGNYFELQGQIYRQDEGMAMGSPLSPVFANIFMEDFEQKALASANFKPEIWLRYVDDTFVVWSHGDNKLDDFLKHLNNISKNIKLTVEKEKDMTLAFLDVNVRRENQGLKTSVYRKKTHTGRYLNFESNHSNSVKEGVAISLFDRANSIISDNSILKEEIKNITDDLRMNGYPLKTIKKCQRPRRINKTPEDEDKPKAYISIPYIPKISEKIRRIARKYKVKTAFKSTNTIRQHLIKTKPYNEQEASKNCVYSIKCECDREYIGETKRPLAVRVNEHKKNTRNGETNKSKLAQHAWDNEHKFKWDEARIIHKEQHYYKRKFVEGALIKLNNDPISQSSVEVRPLWLPFLNKHFEKEKIKTQNLVKINKVPPTSKTHNMTLRPRPPRVGR